ncbi:hypothetical protein QJS10_CPB15g00749 [Acorus calamus]|uniref:Uncharacterized protein n=1 Tax=Acorus calamus TaxID=4465 RepID=A0AAV9D3F8_ACOCL|nr:hypothetical protein QJS10_CPB15g00749 [Acorus calamus]
MGHTRRDYRKTSGVEQSTFFPREPMSPQGGGEVVADPDPKEELPETRFQ